MRWSSTLLRGRPGASGLLGWLSHDQGATWELVGLISLLDPPRADSAETIKHAQALGVEASRHNNFTRTVVCMVHDMLTLSAYAVES